MEIKILKYVNPIPTFLVRLSFSSISELKTNDPMKGANQAASFICFKKYPKIFLKGSGLKIQNDQWKDNV